MESRSPVGPKILKISLCMSQQSVYSNRCMAWYNATGKENDKSLYETPTIDVKIQAAPILNGYTIIFKSETKNIDERTIVATMVTA